MKVTKTVFIYEHERLLRTVSVWVKARIDKDYRLELEPNSTHLRIER